MAYQVAKKPIRRGLGDTSTVDLTTLYPAMPGATTPDAWTGATCPDGSPIPASGVCGSSSPLGPSQSLTAWFNQNSTTVLVAGVAIFAAALLGVRR